MSETNQPGSQANRDRKKQGNEATEETELYFSSNDVVRILDDYLEAMKAGTAPTRAELLSAHPELAEQLDACLTGLDFLHSAQSSGEPNQQLGDFRIVREVGRGGMGAVFEAIQVSLGRRVALKILRFNSVSDRDAIERFQREAETVATLHHTNIVPIFFVGSEKGVNYYAMQFIEGRNLAEVLADSDAKLSVPQVVSWGLQAAEALAHAHRRGVIHRDVKPSNLILDKDQRLWLTDFGLARRIDDVTLSLTGMLLGTPRYMSPEHARASSKRIDHRSDLFSLGATLYELLTGQPAFPGDVAHDVIQHILVDDPKPIRQLNLDVPRDMETIVMKCMAKEPAQRYASAEELATDLRAVLEDRPIQARRASLIEQAVRWFKQNQRSVSQISTAAMVTLAITLTSLLGWTSYQSWNASSIKLETSQPPLVAEILTNSGELLRTETLPMQNSAKLPAGDYMVRASMAGALSESFAVSLERGAQNTKYSVDVTDSWMITHRPLYHSFDVFDLGTERAIAVWNEDGITVHLHRGPQTQWSLKLSPESTNQIANWPSYLNPRRQSGMQDLTFGAMNESRPWMVHEFVDVNRDGVGDIVCAARHQAWLMAISGTGEGVLWFASRGKELAEKNEQRNFNYHSSPHSTVLYPPTLGSDLDNDGVQDLIALIADPGTTLKPIVNNGFECEVWIEAISTRTGETIWRHELAKDLFALPAGEQAPYDLRWFGNMFNGRSSQGGATMQLGLSRLRTPQHLEQTGAHIYKPTAPQIIQLGNSERVLAMVAGDKALSINLETGELREPAIELGFRPGREVQWGDVDGDSNLDLIALERIIRTGTTQSTTPKLHVWSIAARKSLWSKELDAYWPSQAGWGAPAPCWPLVCDLNDDGRSEIVVPDGRTHENSFNGGPNTSSLPSGRYAVFGADATPRWAQSVANIDASLEHVIDGPDLDGDGTRELFVASAGSTDSKLHVDTFSGATGAALWSSSHLLQSENHSDLFRLLSLDWWQSGADGWPQLLVTISDGRFWSSGSGTQAVVGFSAGTGAVTTAAREIAEVKPSDVNGDGVEDLIVCSAKAHTQGALGSFHCVRGIAQQPWRKLGFAGQPKSDLDGDEVQDLITTQHDGIIRATSGATGRELWQSHAIRTLSPLNVYAAPSSDLGDLNGDGISELLAVESHLSGRPKSPVSLLSGRNGKRIWELKDVTIQSISGTLAAQFTDLEHDGAPEILWFAAVDYGYVRKQHYFSTHEVQLWCFAINAKTGSLRWAQPLSPQYSQSNGNGQLPMHIQNIQTDIVSADFNGDGIDDLVLPAIRDDGVLETRLLSGLDGRVLWRRARQSDGLGQQSLENLTAPAVCDFEGDGRPDLIMIEPFNVSTNDGTRKVEVAITAVDSAGKELWSKSTGKVFTHFRSSYHFNRKPLLRPVIIHEAGESNAKIARRTAQIAVLIPGDPVIVVIDANGHFVSRKLTDSLASHDLLAHDINGDGQEELLFMDRANVIAVSGKAPDKSIWETALGQFGHQSMVQIVEGSEKFPPTLVVQTDASDNSVLGLDIANGAVLWRCPGPVHRTDQLTTFVTPQEVALLGGKADELPLVAYLYDSFSECRRAFAASGKHGLKLNRERRGGSSLASLGAQPRPPVLTSPKVDLRWKRPLPWRPDARGDYRFYSFVGWATFFSVTLLVIPTSYLWLIISRKRFQLSYLLMLPIVAAIFLQAALISAPADNDFTTLLGRISTGLGFAPPVFSLIFICRWSLERRWRLVAIWLTVVLAVSFVVAAISIASSVRIAPMVEKESFDWSGWYLVVLPGAYLTSWILVIFIGLGAVVSELHRLSKVRRESAKKARKGRTSAPPQVK